MMEMDISVKGTQQVEGHDQHGDIHYSRRAQPEAIIL